MLLHVPLFPNFIIVSLISLCTWLFDNFLPVINDSPWVCDRYSDADLVSVLEPCPGLEKGCEWRSHLPTSVGFYVLPFLFRPILRHILFLESNPALS